MVQVERNANVLGVELLWLVGVQGLLPVASGLSLSRVCRVRISV